MAGTYARYSGSGGGGGGVFALTDLSNLASTLVNADINPGNTDTINLGNPTVRYLSIATDVVSVKYSRFVVVSGTFTHTIPNKVAGLVCSTTGEITTGVVTMPAAPIDGQVCTITTNNQIDSLQILPNSGQTIVTTYGDGSTGLMAGQSTAYIYVLTETTWYPWD